LLCTLGKMSLMLFIWCFDSLLAPYPMNSFFSLFLKLSELLLEIEAKERIPRDPDDWHTVALAIHLNTAIWTQDNDFLGCGCPCWTTDTLISHLKRTS